MLTGPFSSRVRTSKGSTMKKLTVLCVLLFAGVASAQPKNAPKAPAGGGDKGKVKVYDFSGDTIEGDLIKPEGSTVDARDFAKQEMRPLRPPAHGAGCVPTSGAKPGAAAGHARD